MGKVLIASSIVFFFLGIAGCKTTGYTIRLQTAALNYSEISSIEATLANKGYNMTFKEKLRQHGADPNDVTSFFEKKFSREEVIQGVDPDAVNLFQKRYNDERYWGVFINMSYLKDVPTNGANHVNIDLYNQFIGGISPKVKTEIDSLGDLIYQELSSKVGRENVMIERKEWGPPRFY